MRQTTAPTAKHVKGGIGAAKCEFFDAGGVKRKGKQDIDEEEDASAKKATSSDS